MENIKFKPIGVIKTHKSSEEIKSSLRGVSGRIIVFDEYAPGLEGIEGFSHLIVIAYLHKTTDTQKRTLKVKPFRRFAIFGIDVSDVPEVGVFCTDSPHRPNPIALSIVKLSKREGSTLYVEGVDLFDNTPVLDIKPYTPSRCIKNIRVPDWYSSFRERVLKQFDLFPE